LSVRLVALEEVTGESVIACVYGWVRERGFHSFHEISAAIR
jgi:hypothetical protein